MAGQPGKAKTGGRKRGVPNKKTFQLEELAERLGVNPVEILLRFAKGDWKALGYPERETIVGYSATGQPIYKDVIPADLRIKASSESAQYIFPKRKAIEHSGPNGGPIEVETVYEADFGESAPTKKDS